MNTNPIEKTQSLAVSPGMAEDLVTKWYQRAARIAEESDRFNDVVETYGAGRRQRAAAIIECASELLDALSTKAQKPKSVPRGLDEAAVIQLISKMESHSVAANEEAGQVAEDHIDGCLCAYQDGLAYAYNDCAKWLRDALRKQETEHREKSETEAGNQP